MNEDLFAGRVAAHLSAAARGVEGVAAERLHTARMRALDAQRGAGLSSMVRDRAVGLRMRVRLAFMPGLRTAATVMALLGLFLVGDYWATVSRVAELREVDAALLMDDLPIEAYLDPDFRAWLSRES